MFENINQQALRDALDEHAIVSMTDAGGSITHVNQKFLDMSGYTEAELVGKNHRMLKSGAHPSSFYQQMWDTLLSGKTWQGEVCNRRKNGDLYWVRATIKPILDGNDLPQQYISIRTDITEVKRAEEAAHRSELLLHRVIDAIPDLIFFKDKKGKYLGCNRAFEQYFGAREAQIVGRTDFEFVDNGTANFFRQMDMRMLAAGQAQSNEEWVTYPDGRKVLLEVLKMPYHYGGGATGVIGISHDITERKRHLQALQQSEERWAFAVEGAGDGVWDWNMQTGAMLLSRLYEAMLGYDEHELPQTVEAWFKSVHPDDLARAEAGLHDYLAGKLPAYVVEFRLQCKDGGYKWVLCRGKTVEYDADGKAVRMIGINSDISERKQNEQQLDLFREMIENTGQPIFMLDVEDNYRLAYANQAAVEHWGASKEELLTWRMADWDPTHDARGMASRFAETVGKPGVLLETRHRLKDGRTVPVEVFTNARMIGGKPYTFGSFQNIEARKRNEESLLLFRRIFEASEQAIGIADGEGRLLYINSAHERMHKCRQEDVAGKHFSVFLTREALALGPAIVEATDRGESWVGLLPQKRGDGTEFVSFSHIGVILGGDAKPQYLFNILYDYTAELDRQQELRSARDRAEAANRAKSDFLASMSHELRTPLNAILGFSQLMEVDESCSTDQRENLQQISKAGWHLLDLINEVLDLARVESGEVKLEIEDIEPAAIVAECLSLLSPLLAQKHVAIDNRIGAEVPKVRADYMRLKQVLINLLSNAIKYNRQGGQVVIEATDGADGTLALAVRDTGRGMTAEQLAKLFEPFTRFGDTEKVHGTGIGLSICRKLVERMNGKILVESTPNVGSVFSIVLPPGGTVIAQPPLQTGQLSLLYIEDDQAQQSLLGKWASKLGWRVDFANDATLGIDAAMTRGYHAILLDIDLPGGFSGLDVKSVLDDMESLRSIPVIAISNLVQQHDVDRAMQAGFTAYLPKPVDLQELERVIQRAVRGGHQQ